MSRLIDRLAACGLLAASLLSPLAQSASVVVSPNAMNGWAFSNADNTGRTASGQFVTGPETAPLGNGSANLVVGAADSSEVLYNTSLNAGALLSSVKALSYWTYVSQSSSSHSGAAPTLQFDIAYNSPSVAGYNGRLVFDPGLTGLAVLDRWQDWNALTADAWYFTRSPGNADCQLNTGNYCTLSEVLALFPDITLLDVLFKAGGSLDAFNGSIDGFIYNTGDSRTTVDFEPAMTAPASVPEPVTLALAGLALGGMAVSSRWRRRG